MAITIGSRGFSRALRVLLTLGALAAVAGFPTAAHAKKQKKLQMDPNVEQPAAPAGPVPPEADANGHVNYGNPQAEGLGRVTVKSKTGDKIQVYLEGRYFGDAPITIYSVPKGDYIVEGTIVSSGKQVSSPVSVTENEEATVELGSAKADTPVVEQTSGAGGGWSSLSPTRQKIVYTGLAVTAVGLIGTVVFAILENSAENDYEAAPAGNQANLDSISNRGKRDATLTDVGLLLLGAGVATTVIAGYPIFFHPSEKAPDTAAPATAFLAPVFGRSTAGAAFSMRF